MRRLGGRLVLALAAASTAAQAGSGPAALSGLCAVDVDGGTVTSLGGYHNPSVDGPNRLLYADNGHGALVRWSLAGLEGEPEAFVQPQDEKDPGYAFPLAAPQGGMVAAFRAFPVRAGRQIRYFRVCLDVFDNGGQHLAGPLPLFRTKGSYNGALAAAWHPDGDRLAFAVTEGTEIHGTYVFFPADKNWVRAERLEAGFASPVYVCWQPGGRILSVQHSGRLWLRGGGEYAAFRSFDTLALLHTWLDNDTLLLDNPRAGIEKVDITMTSAGVIPGWRDATTGGYRGISSPVAVSRHGLAWVGPAAENSRLALHYVPAGGSRAKPVVTFPGSKAPYAAAEAGPVWQPAAATVFVRTTGPVQLQP